MLYSFDIHFLEPAFRNYLIVPVILDLPQNNIQDVRHNPFVVDLVNHPFIKSGLVNMPGNKSVLVDNIQSCNSIVPNTAVKIPCKYKASPGDSEFKTFAFNIYFNYPAGYVPVIPQLEFTCGCLYDAYELLFQSGNYVLTPRIPYAQCQIAVGDYLKCILLGACELMKVTGKDTTNGILVDSVAENGTISSLRLNRSSLGQLRPIRLNDQLMAMIGFNYFNNKDIYGLKGVNYFEGVIANNGAAKLQVFVKRETVGYSLIIYDSTAKTNCRLLVFFYLHELQDLLQKEYHTSINIDQSQLINICRYLNETARLANIVSQIHSVLSQYYSQNQSTKPSREQIISYIANYFGITPQQAQKFMVLMCC